jgi:membrane protease subunit (stomatin/prohibitin family)
MRIKEDTVGEFKNFNITNTAVGELFSRQKIAADLEKKDKEAELVVSEGNVAFLILDGKKQATLAPNRYKVFGKKDGLADKFDKKRLDTLEVVFVSNKSSKKDVAWGIPHREMESIDPTTKTDYHIGAYGIITVQISNPERFFGEWLTDKKTFSVEDFQVLLLPRIKVMVKSAILNTIEKQNLAYHQLDARAPEISKTVYEIIKPELEKTFAINVTEFIINKITIPDEDKEQIKLARKE